MGVPKTILSLALHCQSQNQETLFELTVAGKSGTAGTKTSPAGTSSPYIATIDNN